MLNWVTLIKVIAISLPYKKHLNLSIFTGFTLSILNIDFHILNIISICHIKE